MCSTETIRLLHNPETTRENAQLQTQRKLVERYLDEERFEEGLQASLDAVKRFPEKPTLTHSWALDFLLSLEEKRKAIKVLEHGLHHGAWWSPKLIKTGWGGLEDQPEFPRIMEACRKRFNEEAATVKAEVIVKPPEKYSRAKMYPLILILHGAYSNNDNSQYIWMNALRKRSVLSAFLQSSQIMSSDHFVWDDEDVALRDVKNALLTLGKNYGESSSNVILGGVSRGAEIALLSLFSDNTRADGFISVIPSVGTFTKRFIEKANPLTRKDLRGFIITGEEDPRHHNTQLVFKFLRDQGIVCQLHSAPGVGHTIPENFDIILEQAINFVLKE